MELDKKRPKLIFRTVSHALLVLGINTFKGRPRNELHRLNNFRKPNFWERNDLQFVLVDAKKAYIQAIKQSHPDKGGDTSQAIEINKAWEFIEKRFADKGYKLN